MEVASMEQQAELRVKEISDYAMNAAYFINRLRRKQALIKLKQEMDRAIVERDQASEGMTAQITEAIELFNENVD